MIGSVGRPWSILIMNEQTNLSPDIKIGSDFIFPVPAITSKSICIASVAQP